MRTRRIGGQVEVHCPQINNILVEVYRISAQGDGSTEARLCQTFLPSQVLGEGFHVRGTKGGFFGERWLAVLREVGQIVKLEILEQDALAMGLKTLNCTALMSAFTASN